MDEILDLFEDFGTDIICVEDCDITINGALITHITSGPNGVQAWSGHPDEKHSEEILFESKEQRNEIFNRIADNF